MSVLPGGVAQANNLGTEGCTPGYAHEGVGYPYRRFQAPFEIVAQVNAALTSKDRQRILTLAGTLDAANNLGCPLS
jgi:hypothetical protein